MKRGYTILIIIIILSLVGVLLVTTANFLGVDAIKNSVTKKDSSIGFYLSTACAEYAIAEIKNAKPDPTLPAQPIQNEESEWTKVIIDDSLGYSCQYKISDKAKSQIIETKSDIENFPHYLELMVKTDNQKIIISSWQEK